MTSVRPQTYTEGEKVLAYDPRTRRGKFAKWQVCWKGPVAVERRLNDTNYVLQKFAKSKPVVVHVDHMRKLPQPMDIGSSDPYTHTEPQSATLCKQLRTATTHTDTDTDADNVVPVIPADTTDRPSLSYHSTDAAAPASQPVAQSLLTKSRPLQAYHPQRQRRQPARLLSNVSTHCTVIGQSQSGLWTPSFCCESCGWLLSLRDSFVAKSVESVVESCCSADRMSRRRGADRDGDFSGSESSSSVSDREG